LKSISISSRFFSASKFAAATIHGGTRPSGLVLQALEPAALEGSLALAATLTPSVRPSIATGSNAWSGRAMKLREPVGSIVQ
jgi:hypothetical protein